MRITKIPKIKSKKLSKRYEISMINCETNK